MKRKIVYITGSRADYGLMRSVLFRINASPGLELHIIATGMHIMPEFGNTIEEIRRDGFNIHCVNSIYAHDTKESMVTFIGEFIQQCIRKIEEIQPDLILLLGDRAEMLGGAIVGVYMGIPVVHIHGGEVTMTVDEIARHAITKLSHIHLPATQDSADRIIRMGEDPNHVFVVGAPGLDQIREIESSKPEIICKKFNLDLSKPIILVIQHPVTLDEKNPVFQIQQTLEAIKEIHEQTLIIYPNADSGGRKMIDEIDKMKKNTYIHIVPSLPHTDFLSLLRIASVLVGNSSSGIIEAPSFGIPAVNIGTRQSGRTRGENVIDSGYDKNAIKSAILFALHDNEFRFRVKTAKNPYGDGKSAERIVDILEKMCLTPDLIQKRMMY
jgi:GDP/UDP-N,N'-diacetylbacillosamine 2-epimerase (hydrolysing)